MNDQISKVLNLITDANKVDLDLLEAATFEIIEDDAHNQLPPEIQSIVYDLNMKDINDSTVEKYQVYATTLNSYLTTGS